MLERIFIPLDGNGQQDMTLSNAPGNSNLVPDFDYGVADIGNLPAGFDRIWLQWFADTNSVEVKINNHVASAVSIDDLDDRRIQPISMPCRSNCKATATSPGSPPRRNRVAC